MTKTIWVSTSTATTYVPREKPIQESVSHLSALTFSGAAPSTTNLATNTGQRILAVDGTWIPQPAFTSGGADQLETLRPSVFSTSYSANPPTVTDSAKAYDSDTNHATTFGQWYAAQEARTNNRVDIFSLTTWASKTQTWTAATINVSRSYAILQDGESSATSGSSSKTSSVKYEFSIDNGSNWTTLGTDTQSSIPTAPQTLSMALGTLSPTMGNILVKVTMTRGGGGTIYEDGVSLPGLTGEIDLKLFDVWIDGTYAGGAGNITCNNLTVTGDATFQNKIYDSTASAGSTGQVLKVLSNGKVGWQTDTVGTGTVTSVGISGSNGIGVTNSPITTSGTIALSLGAITPTSISTGTGSFSGDVEFAASIKSPNGSNSPIVIAPDGTGDLHVNADSLRLGDNNADATIATNGTGDLILTTHEGSATQGIIRIYDGANGNITLTPNGTGQVQVGSDQVVTLTASQTLTNKSLSGSSNTFTNIPNSATTATSANTASAIVARDASGNFSAGTITATLSGNATNVTGTVAVANGGTGSTTLTSGSYVVGNGTSAVTLKTPTQVTADLDTFTYQIGGTAGKKGLVPAAPAIGASVVYLDQTGSWTTPSGSGTTTNALTIQSPLTGTSFNGSTAVTIALASGYGDTQNPYGSKTANYFLASPNGTAGSPTFRAIVAADIPTLNQNTTGTAANITATSNTTLTTLSSLVSIGTITTGTWNASAIGVAYGGTGLTTLTAGYIPYGNGTSAFGSSANLFWDSTNSRLGVGTSSPRAKLETSGSIFATSRSIPTGGAGPEIWWSGTVSGISSYDRTNSAYKPLLLEAEYSYFTTANGSEQMRINNTGVGIGTASPSQKLEVNGAALVNGSTGFMRVAVTGTPTSGTAALQLSVNSVNARTIRMENTESGGHTYDIINGSGGVAGNIGIYDDTAGAYRLVIDSSGNVGIGNTPSEKLQIGSNSGNNYTRIDAGTNGISGIKLYAGNSYRSALYYNDAAGTTYLSTYAGSSQTLALDGAGTILFQKNGSEQVRINTNGNVGIGTTSPQGRLNVSESSNSTVWSGIFQNSSNAASGNAVGIKLKISDFSNTAESTKWVGISSVQTAGSYNDYMGMAFYTKNGPSVTPAEVMRIDNSGNLGLGTTAGYGGRINVVPASTPTTVAGGNQIQIGEATSNTGYRLQLGYINDATAGYIGSIQSYAGGAVGNMTLQGAGGNLGLGTTNPATKLHAYASGNCVIRADNSSSSFEIQSNSNDGYINLTGSGNMIFRSGTSVTEKMRIDSSGNLLIGNTNGTEKLTVTGKIKASDVLLGNNGSKGYGAITTTSSTSTPTGGSSGDHYYIY